MCGYYRLSGKDDHAEVNEYKPTSKVERCAGNDYTTFSIMFSVFQERNEFVNLFYSKKKVVLRRQQQYFRNKSATRKYPIQDESKLGFQNKVATEIKDLNLHFAESVIIIIIKI